MMLKAQAIKEWINWTSSKLKTFLLKMTQESEKKAHKMGEKIYISVPLIKVLCIEYIKNNSTIKKDKPNLKVSKGFE